MANKRPSLSLLAGCLCAVFVQGQAAITATGGNATGSGSSISYTVRQVTYQTFEGTTGTVAQGVQQPYEISVMTTIENMEGITLEYKIYPNPTSGSLRLLIKPYDNENFRYKLFDINGLSLPDNTKTMFIGGKNTEGPWAIYLSTDNGAGVTTPRIVVSGTTGHVAVNQTGINSTYQFYVNGPAGGTTAWNSTSDAKYKTNVKTIESPLQKVLDLRGVTFNFIDNPNFEKGIRMGFIAQEVLPVIPEVITNTEAGYTMQYAPLTALLVEAVKEQQNLINKQEAELQSLKDELNQIRAMLARRFDE